MPETENPAEFLRMPETENPAEFLRRLFAEEIEEDTMKSRYSDGALIVENTTEGDIEAATERGTPFDEEVDVVQNKDVAQDGQYGPGLKYDDGKDRWDLLPLDACREIGLAIGTLNVLAAPLGVCTTLDILYSIKAGADRTEALSVLAGRILKVAQAEIGYTFPTSDSPFDQLPDDAIRQVVLVLTHGAEKYGPNNWQRVEDFERRYEAAMIRHIYDWDWGYSTDPDSDLPHLAHAACCAVFLVWGALHPEVVR